MKKLYLKKGIENFIVTCQILIFVLLGSDCENFSLFIISRIILICLFLFNHYIIKNYTRFYEGNDYE